MRCCPMADSKLILELMFLHIRGGCSLTVLLLFLKVWKYSFRVRKEVWKQKRKTSNEHVNTQEKKKKYCTLNGGKRWYRDKCY